MSLRATRRGALLLLPAGLAACAAPAPVLEGPAIGYSYLLPLRLDVAEVVVEDFTPTAGPNDLGRELRPSAAEAVRVMGRDRLFAFGRENRARFRVVRAEILRARASEPRGLFAPDPGERLDCTLACRLDILGPDERRLGFVEAQAARSRTAESSPAARRVVAESLLRLAMFDLNTEFEFQLRRALRPFLVEAPAQTPAPAVDREALPGG